MPSFSARLVELIVFIAGEGRTLGLCRLAVNVTCSLSGGPECLCSSFGGEISGESFAIPVNFLWAL
jgi:hypothetical protein